jgi:hypothetical protein
MINDGGRGFFYNVDRPLITLPHPNILDVIFKIETIINDYVSMAHM